MASRRSIRNCPICKRQLKKEEFHELTSGVCCICQNRAKFPVLTVSGSLSCWACHYKTQCDQGLPPSQVIPIYGTEDESEDEADPAIPPRPVLQPDENTTHVVHIDESDDSHVRIDESDDSNTEESSKVTYGCVCLSQIFLVLQMIAVLHLTLWIWPKDDVLYTLSGFTFIGCLLLLISITIGAWMKPAGNMVYAAFTLGMTIFLVTMVVLPRLDVVKMQTGKAGNNWTIVCGVSFVINFCLAILSLPSILSVEDVRVPHLFWSANIQMLLGLTIQALSALTFCLLNGSVSQFWWYFTSAGNVLTLISVAFFVIGVLNRTRFLSILSSLIYLIAAGVMIFKFCSFAMDVDMDNKPVDGTLEANSVELFGYLICGAAHLSVMSGSWKLF
jgi:hypothetical protein